MSLLHEDAARHVLMTAAAQFSPNVALSCSFGGPGGMVLAHMLASCAPNVPVLFIDTGYLFPETYTLKQMFTERYNLRVLDFAATLSPTEQAAQKGQALWDSDPDACCHIRKVEPMARALESLDAWITALRRDQSSSRADVRVFEEHATATGRKVTKINPLAYWTGAQVWEYLYTHQVPYNPLLDDGYKSIGCIQCTKRVKATADERDGRWEGHAKTECGLHTFTKPVNAPKEQVPAGNA